MTGGHRKIILILQLNNISCISKVNQELRAKIDFLYYVFDITRGNFPSFQSDTGQGWKVYKCCVYPGLNFPSTLYIGGS